MGRKKLKKIEFNFNAECLAEWLKDDYENLKTNLIFVLFLSLFFFLYRDHLFSDEFSVHMVTTKSLDKILKNGSMMLSVISYNNLTNFLPPIYFERNR